MIQVNYRRGGVNFFFILFFRSRIFLEKTKKIRKNAKITFYFIFWKNETSIIFVFLRVFFDCFCLYRSWIIFQKKQKKHKKA